MLNFKKSYSYLFSVTGRDVVVSELLVIIVLVIKIFQSILFLQLTELTTHTHTQKLLTSKQL